MIIGIGTDMVQIPRIEKLWKDFGKKFLEKNFHISEQKDFYNIIANSSKTPNKIVAIKIINKQISYLAKRFAAKEAFSKALGTGISEGLKFKDISITNNNMGAPKIIIYNTDFAHLNDYDIHISLSDDYPVAIAFVVINK